jgi:RNA polymerase sigma factor (sigma-70 family)
MRYTLGVSPTTVQNLTTEVLAERQRFKSFVASRVGNESDAEDVLQNGLLKALQSNAELKNREKLIPWFYQVLRNAITDHLRSRNASTRREEAWASDTGQAARDAEAERHLCRCFEQLLPALKPNQAELLRRIELHDEPISVVANSLGMTVNSATVALHRARAALRKRMTEFCAGCACLEDCSCD